MPGTRPSPSLIPLGIVSRDSVAMETTCAFTTTHLGYTYCYRVRYPTEWEHYIKLLLFTTVQTIEPIINACSNYPSCGLSLTYRGGNKFVIYIQHGKHVHDIYYLLVLYVYHCAPIMWTKIPYPLTGHALRLSYIHSSIACTNFLSGK